MLAAVPYNPRMSQKIAGREGVGEKGRAALRAGGWVAVAAAILVVALLRLRLADVPLERDEGEYAYAGQLILQGVPPYGLAYNMKFPGTYYAYAAMLALFGASARGIHTGLLLVNVATILLVWLLGRRLAGDLAGAAAAWVFAALSLDRWIMGVFAHATHFAALLVTAGLYVLLLAEQRRRMIWFAASGALLGAAVLMKQHAILFLPLGAFLVVWSAWEEDRRALRAAGLRVASLAAGSVAPVALVLAVFLFQGVLGRFWFWTFRYAKEYVTELPLSRAPAQLSYALSQITQSTLALWIAAGVGLAALWVARFSATTRAYLTGLLIASFAATCPGFYFREHYFIVMLPALALLVGAGAAALDRLVATVAPARLARAAAAAVVALLVGSYAIAERGYLFSMSPRELSRVRYGSNPFVESPEVARYIRERTSPGDRIAVLGSEPQIYFYAGRRSATGYLYTYPLMEPQRYARQMQEEMRREIEAAHPVYLVFAQVSASWLARPQSDQWILRWGNRYVRDCYDLVGVADIYSKNETRYVWEQEARGYKPVSDSVLYTFRRKSDAPCAVDPALR